MIVAVNWQYIIVTASGSSSSHRVARRVAAGDNPFVVYQAGMDTPSTTPTQFSGDTWHRNAPWPAPIHYPAGVPFPTGLDYTFGFWAISGQDMTSGSTYAQVLGDANANETFGGASAWGITANAFYFRAFDEGGGGDEALYVDMFDIQQANVPPNYGFIAPDFVDVTPDPTHALTPAANDGYIDTSTQVLPGANNRITVAARDQVSQSPVLGWQFDHWHPVLLRAHDSANPPLVGAPDAHDLVVGNGD